MKNHLIIAAFLISGSAGAATTFGPGTFATLSPDSSNKVLDARVLASHPGSPVELRSVSYKNQQSWSLTPIATDPGTPSNTQGQMQLVNSQGYCLGLASWSLGSPVLTPCTTASGEPATYSLWTAEALGNIRYQLKNTHTEECLTQASWSPTRVTTGPCNGHIASQKFNIQPTPRRQSAASASLESTLHRGEAIALTAKLDRPGAEAYLAPMYQGETQDWEQIALLSNPKHRLDAFLLKTRTPNGGSLCLGLPVWSSTVPTALSCQPGNVDRRQQWEVYPSADELIGIDGDTELTGHGLRNRDSKQCLTLSNAPISDGRKLTMRACDIHRADQRFDLTPTPTAMTYAPNQPN